MIPRHEHMYPREDKIRLVSSVTCGEINVSEQLRIKDFPLYFYFIPVFSPTPQWSPCDWPRSRCCPKCHTGVFEHRSHPRWLARGLSLTGSKKRHLALNKNQRITCFNWSILTDAEPEVVEGVLVDDVKLPHKCKSKLHHCANVHVLSVVFLRHRQKWAPIRPTHSLNCTVVGTKCGGCQWIYCTIMGWKVSATWAQSGPGVTLRPVAAM